MTEASVRRILFATSLTLLMALATLVPAVSAQATNGQPSYLGMDRGAWTIVILVLLFLAGLFGIWYINRTPGKGPRHP